MEYLLSIIFSFFLYLPMHLKKQLGGNSSEVPKKMSPKTIHLYYFDYVCNTPKENEIFHVFFSNLPGHLASWFLVEGASVFRLATIFLLFFYLFLFLLVCLCPFLFRDRDDLFYHGYPCSCYHDIYLFWCLYLLI